MDKMNERLEAITKLEGLAKSGDEANIRLAYQLNKGNKLMTDADLVALLENPLKSKILELAEMVGGVSNVKLAEDIVYYSHKDNIALDEDFVEHLMTRGFKHGFGMKASETHFINEIEYSLNNTLKLNLKNIKLQVSSQFNKTEWSSKPITDFISKLEEMFSTQIV
jgi:hypothetical protein